MQVIRDEFSGWIRAFPISKRDASTVVKNLLSFLGPLYNQPCIMIKSDQATETRLAAQQLGFVFEGTLENRHPTIVFWKETYGLWRRSRVPVTCKLVLTQLLGCGLTQ